MAEKGKIGGMQEALLKKPARDLSNQEGFDVFLYLVEQGEIDLVTPVRAADDGTVPLLIGQQVAILPQLAGVDFYHANGFGTATNGSAGSANNANMSPTPTFAVLLYRLAKG